MNENRDERVHMVEKTEKMPAGGATLPFPGELFAGKYTIQAEVGSGGFARIYRAVLEEVGRTVAIKVLVPQMPPPNLYSDELAARFSREARAVGDLQSPYSVTMYDFGRSERGLLYMVFEFVDGRTVEDALAEEGPMPVRRVVHVLEQLLMSLQEIHEAGLLHRDIKPANVMLTEVLGDSDHVKLVDFGIAKSWDHPRGEQDVLEDLTQKDHVVGTPRYMAPEQILGQTVTPATDFYSLGLVCWEMLAGEPCVDGDAVTDMMRQHLNREPFELPPAEMPPDLRHVLRQMLQKHPKNRPSSAREVLAILRGTPEEGRAPASGLHPRAQASPADEDSVTSSELTVPLSVEEEMQHTEPEEVGETVPMNIPAEAPAAGHRLPGDFDPETEQWDAAPERGPTRLTAGQEEVRPQNSAFDWAFAVVSMIGFAIVGIFAPAWAMLPAGAVVLVALYRVSSL